MSSDDRHKQHWQANKRLLSILLGVWFLFSCVLPIIAVDSLNKIQFGGFKLGFWVAQQGSIIVFLILILVYAIGMKKIDSKYGFEEKEDSK